MTGSALEPGPYRVCYGGVRLEDILVDTEDGAEVVTDHPYDLSRSGEVASWSPVADPAPLGLAGFADLPLERPQCDLHPGCDLDRAGALLWRVAQLLSGMWEFRNRNVFGATAFSTYGAFWLGLGIFVVLIETTKLGGGLHGADVPNSLAWFLMAFAIFNFYMLLWSSRINLAVFGVFLTLQVTEVLLVIGFFREAHGNGAYILHAGGWAGVVTAAVAWYASAAGVVNGMSPTPVVPVGRPMWGRMPKLSKRDSPMPRRTEV